jgi:hypothetical protein
VLGRLNSPGMSAVYSGPWFSRRDVCLGCLGDRIVSTTVTVGEKGKKQINLGKLATVIASIREGRTLPAGIPYLLKVKHIIKYRIIMVRMLGLAGNICGNNSR